MNGWDRLLRMALAGFLLAVLAACGSLPPAKERSAEHAASADPSTRLAKIAAASTPPGEHSGFRLMPLGVYSLDARIQLAQRAQQSLVVQYYQLENDAVGRLLAAHAARSRGARREGAGAGGRPLHRQEPAAAAGAVGNAQCAGAALQPVLLRPQRLSLALRGLALGDRAAQPPHAQQALHRRRRDGGGGRAQHRRRVFRAQRGAELHRHGRAGGRQGGAAARIHLRRLLEQRAGLAHRRHREGRGRPHARQRRVRRLDRHGRAAAQDRAAAVRHPGLRPDRRRARRRPHGPPVGRGARHRRPADQARDHDGRRGHLHQRDDEGLGPPDGRQDRGRPDLAVPRAGRARHGRLRRPGQAQGQAHAADQFAGRQRRAAGAHRLCALPRAAAAKAAPTCTS
jgi:hypothetical protein